MSENKLILKIAKVTDKLGSRNEVSSAMISLVVWNAVTVLGPENAAEWISGQVNEAMKSAVKVRKRHGLIR